MNMKVQCVLSSGNKTKTGWIDYFSKMKEGSMVYIEKDKSWWKIIHMGKKLSVEEVEERKQDYKYQRKASDI